MLDLHPLPCKAPMLLCWHHMQPGVWTATDCFQLAIQEKWYVGTIGPETHYGLHVRRPASSTLEFEFAAGRCQSVVVSVSTVPPLVAALMHVSTAHVAATGSCYTPPIDAAMGMDAACCAAGGSADTQAAMLPSQAAGARHTSLAPGLAGTRRVRTTEPKLCTSSQGARKVRYWGSKVEGYFGLILSHGSPAASSRRCLNTGAA